MLGHIQNIYKQMMRTVYNSMTKNNKLKKYFNTYSTVLTIAFHVKPLTHTSLIIRKHIHKLLRLCNFFFNLKNDTVTV